MAQISTEKKTEADGCYKISYLVVQQHSITTRSTGLTNMLVFLSPCRYNMLFGFLINIRQVQVMLQHCWALQMMHKGSGDRLAPVWQLRSHMSFLIDKIQYYVQVDVIESQFSLLLENIRSTQDFETIQQAHCNFVSSLYRQLFLQATSVSINYHTHS